MKRATGVPVSIEASVTRAPTVKARQPPSITVEGSRLASTAEAAAPRPVSRKIRVPPQTRLFECSSCAANDGPSDRYAPERAHVPTRAGRAATKAPLAARGTLTFSRNELATPGPTVPGSGIRTTATIPITNAARISHQTIRVGAKAYWASALAPIAPSACPPVGAALETIDVARPS